MPRQIDIINVIEKRISSGNYALGGIPGERRLAEEMGVSRTTARRAIQRLVNGGVLTRKANGRLGIHPVHRNGKKVFQVAYLAPAFASSTFEQNRAALEFVASDYPVIIRPVGYVHYDDPVVLETLEGYDAVFLSCIPEPMPALLSNRLSQCSAKVVLFEPTPPIAGVPMIDLLPPGHIQAMLGELERHGHRHVACFNIHRSISTSQRIEQWRLWSLARRGNGRLLNKEQPSFVEPLDAAVSALETWLAAEPLTETALFCTTGPSAMAALRVLQRHGLKIGHDISLVAVDDQRLCRYFYPSITSVSEGDSRPFIRALLEWIVSENSPWLGPSLLQPVESRLFVGESVGPAANLPLTPALLVGV